MLNNFGHNPDETVDFLMDAILDTKTHVKDRGHLIPLKYLKELSSIRHITFTDLNNEIRLQNG